MRIAIDIGHPAHVHFFKHFIREMEKKGHECLITAVDKDIARILLEKYGFDFTVHGPFGRTVLQKVVRIPLLDFRLLRAVQGFKPDVFMGIASFRAAHIAFLKRKRCVIFDDTETGTSSIYLPFTDCVCTPACYLSDLGKKHIRYPGYHELAYLHPDRFNPNPNVLEEAGVKPGERFVIIRFVAWEAVHDIGHSGLSMETRVRAVQEFSKYARVFISSERPLPPEFAPYRMTVSPEKIHHLMAYASLFYGESGTMSVECAVLGVPAIFVHNAVLGNMVELEQTYKCMFTFKETVKEQAGSIQKGIEILTASDVKDRWREKRIRLLQDKVDVTRWMMDFVEQRFITRL